MVVLIQTISGMMDFICLDNPDYFSDRKEIAVAVPKGADISFSQSK